MKVTELFEVVRVGYQRDSYFDHAKGEMAPGLNRPRTQAERDELAAKVKNNRRDARWVTRNQEVTRRTGESDSDFAKRRAEAERRREAIRQRNRGANSAARQVNSRHGVSDDETGRSGDAFRAGAASTSDRKKGQADWHDEFNDARAGKGK